MKVRIETLPEKLLVGKSIRMSLANNKTSEVWNRFMTNKSAITNALGTDLYSIQIYDGLEHFDSFNPDKEFTKWAAIEVSDYDNIPNGFNLITLKEGLYAVFLHKGTVSEFPKTMQYIFGEWLPKSEYQLDNLPHFERLGETYKNNDPNSEEEVWIPIRKA